MNLARKIEELEIEINRTKNRITNNNDAISHIIEKKKKNLWVNLT